MKTPSKKLFCVKFMISPDDDFDVLKAFSGHLAAKLYVESKIKSHLGEAYKPENGCWENAWTYRYSNALNEHDYIFEIEEVEVEEDIVLPPLPSIENENLALKTENIELREKLAHCNGAISSALHFLTMWDGGWDYAKEHVLENMHRARALLEECMPHVQK